MISIKDIYWIAGYLEGEGCFVAQKDYRYKDIYSCRITVGSTDKDVVRKAALILRGDTRFCIVNDKANIKRKEFYQVRINGNKAIGWMMTLYSLMGVRRKAKIKEVINIWRRNA